MATKILMPQLGESVIEGTISAWLKQEGDWIEQFEPILEIETDKVTTEATAEIPGTLLRIMVREGETVAVGTVLALVGEVGEDFDTITSDADFSAVTETTTAPDVEATSPDLSQPLEKVPTQDSLLDHSPYSGRVSPVVRRIAGEHHVDLSRVRGTGRDGRITKKDILLFIESPDANVPAPLSVTRPSIVRRTDASELQPGEVLPLSSIRKAIADHMVLSKRTSPHVTTVFDIDFSAVAAHRSKNKDRFSQDGARLTFTAYIVAAIAQSLRAHPLVNSTWTEEGILLRKDISIGMATAIPDGLIVPVIKKADELSLFELAKTINDLSERAREGRLLPDEVQGGTFTLTNHGVSGSIFAAPIINQPQCGIFGAGKIEKRVKVLEDAIAIRLMAYASLTFDHRILDGVSADGFMTTIKETLENWS